MDRTFFVVVPFAFLPAATLPVFLEKDHARSYMDHHISEDLRMVALCHVQISSLTVPLYAVTTLEDCGVKVHALLGSPVLAGQRELIPVTENRPNIIPAKLYDVEQQVVQCA